MIAPHKMALIFLLAGLSLTGGAAWRYYRYKHREITDASDFLDDDALKWGTFFFIIGGVSFIAVGFFLFFSQRS